MIVYITMYCEILQVFKIKSKYLRLHSQKKSRNFFPRKVPALSSLIHFYLGQRSSLDNNFGKG